MPALIGARRVLLSSARRSDPIAQLLAGVEGFDYTDLDREKVWGASSLPLLYTTSAGETAVSASGNNVGLALDKSQGLPLGGELLSNPGGPFTATTGWSLSGTAATATVVNGKIEIVRGSTTTFFSIPFSTVAGRYYRFVISGEGGTASWFAGVGTSASAHDLYVSSNIAGASAVVAYAQATGTTTYVKFQVVGAVQGSTVNVVSASAKALSGNHSRQPTTAARPTWEAAAGGLPPYLGHADDWLAGSLAPSNTAVTLASLLRVGAGDAQRMIIGSSQANQVLELYTTADGYLRCSLGSSTGLGSDTTDLRGADHVVSLEAGGGTFRTMIDGVVADEGSYSGTIGSTNAMNLGARNAADSTLFTGRIYKTLGALKLAPSLMLPLHRALGQGVVTI